MRNRSRMINDALSDVLRMAEVNSVVSGGFYAIGDWAIRFSPPDKVKFMCLAHGSCWIHFDNQADRTRLHAGDVIIFAAARAFTLSSEPTIPAVEARTLFTGRSKAFIGLAEASSANHDILQIGGHFSPAASHRSLLLDVLPPFIHVKSTAPEAQTLQWIIEQLTQEHDGMPGSALMTSQLGLLLLIQALRAHIATGAPLQASWLRAATDKRVAPILRMMHADATKSWRLEELAKAASMSRTAFANYFKAVAGEAPLSYLTRWRMYSAQRSLRANSATVGELAAALGYATESAFSNAFKRIVGESPTHYSRRYRSTTSK